MSSSKTTALPTFEEIAATASETFRQTFGSEPELSCCAPGRVNLIGEHVDYNDGYVLPMALPMVTLIVGGRRPDNDVDIITCCSSADEPRRIKFSLLQQLQPGKPQWANYVKGVISNFLKVHSNISGFNAVVISNVPVGAGLSSSAALEVATLTFLEQLSGQKLESNAQRAKLCQAAEHEFAGVPCGIMDQMISVSGQKGHAFLLDCQSGVGVQTKFQSDSVVVLICNSNVKHELSHSEYPTRRKQCFKALELMALKSYRDATVDNLAALTNLADSVEQQLLYKRARHVITEIKRTHEAYHALQQHDFKKMGQLMQESHISLRDDFAVSCPEIDTLVAVANRCAGVYGSRMTGGGFGGCTVTLVEQTAVDQVITEMIKEFSSAYNVNAQERLEFYIATPSDGARSLV